MSVSHRRQYLDVFGTSAQEKALTAAQRKERAEKVIVRFEKVGTCLPACLAFFEPMDWGISALMFAENAPRCFAKYTLFLEFAYPPHNTPPLKKNLYFCLGGPLQYF